MIDGAMISGSSKFILHYNFPGFSTGEVKPNRGLVVVKLVTVTWRRVR